MPLLIDQYSRICAERREPKPWSEECLFVFVVLSLAQFPSLGSGWVLTRSLLCRGADPSESRGRFPGLPRMWESPPTTNQPTMYILFICTCIFCFYIFILYIYIHSDPMAEGWHIPSHQHMRWPNGKGRIPDDRLLSGAVAYSNNIALRGDLNAESPQKLK